MPICTGTGYPGGSGTTDPFMGGCCFTTYPTVCPQRWFVDYSFTTSGLPDGGDVAEAHILDAAGIDLGDFGTFLRADPYKMNNPNQRQRVYDQVQGTLYVCKIQALVIESEWSGGPPDRATYDAAFLAHPDYQPIADIWEAHGRPRNWCTLYGPDEADIGVGNGCCYANEDTTTRTAMHADAVQVRVAAYRAS